jgi:hypothetical protein
MDERRPTEPRLGRAPTADERVPGPAAENVAPRRVGRRRAQRTFPALVSIHDVTPRTLPQTLDLIALLEAQDGRRATLLVVPDADWSQADLDVLRQLQDSGYELAAHGWRHRCAGIASWAHRLHSLILSRDLAEHLALDADRIAALITASHRWFAGVGLRAPDLYVPPACAMGRLRRKALHAMPFCMYEYLTGVYHVGTAQFVRLPLVGFEADTRWRRHALRALNALNSTLGRTLNRPLRIAVHPFDLDYCLADELRTLLRRPIRLMSYAELGSTTR